jgi:transmembrane sensor
LWLYIPHQESPLAYASPLREQKDIRLSDGTTIKLNVDSELSVMYSNKTRRVRLERGEALFTIAAGDNRAFEVVAANGRVRDIGTRFGVRIHGFTTSVIVTSGTVDVTIERHDDTHRLVAGEELDYDTEGKVTQARKIDAEASMAWADGLLVLNAATLAEAAEEISRYNDIKILLSDPALNDFRISGTFDLHATHDILAAIEATLPVTSVQEGDQTVLLRRSYTAD